LLRQQESQEAKGKNPSRRSSHNIEQTVKQMAERLGLRYMEEDMRRVFLTRDMEGDGELTQVEIEMATDDSKVQTKEMHSVFVSILEAYKRILERKELVETLKNALYSLFLFNKRHMFARQQKACGFAYGKYYQRVLLHQPLQSTLASVHVLDVLQKPQKLTRPGASEYTAMWMDRVASDKERMLLMGFLQIINTLAFADGDLPKPPEPKERALRAALLVTNAMYRRSSAAHCVGYFVAPEDTIEEHAMAEASWSNELSDLTSSERIGSDDRPGGQSTVSPSIELDL
jgi:hypothetical protein